MCIWSITFGCPLLPGEEKGGSARSWIVFLGRGQMACITCLELFAVRPGQVLLETFWCRYMYCWIYFRSSSTFSTVTCYWRCAFSFGCRRLLAREMPTKYLVQGSALGPRGILKVQLHKLPYEENYLAVWYERRGT